MARMFRKIDPAPPRKGFRKSDSEKKLQLGRRYPCSFHTTKTRTSENTIMTLLIIYSLISLAGCASMAALDLRQAIRRS
jgi:hypothetical protein